MLHISYPVSIGVANDGFGSVLDICQVEVSSLLEIPQHTFGSCHVQLCWLVAKLCDRASPLRQCLVLCHQLRTADFPQSADTASDQSGRLTSSSTTSFTQASAGVETPHASDRPNLLTRLSIYGL